MKHPGKSPVDPRIFLIVAQPECSWVFRAFPSTSVAHPGYSGYFRGSSGLFRALPWLIRAIPSTSVAHSGYSGHFRGSSGLFRALPWLIRAIPGTSMAHPGYSVGGPGYSVNSPAHSSGLFRCLPASSGFKIRGWTVSHPGKCDCYA